MSMTSGFLDAAAAAAVATVEDFLVGMTVMSLGILMPLPPLEEEAEDALPPDADFCCCLPFLAAPLK